MASRLHHRQGGRPRRYRPRGRRETRGEFCIGALALWAIIAAAIWFGMPQLAAVSQRMAMTPEQRAEVERSAYYRNCDAARAAGAAPIYRGQPGYREAMDGDLDGIACEPYR
ncbi:excalibur calcium-binding domain-containing protein [Sphingomonas soli]|uniref:excalibur calcium-binding domain-containing protein n=1 Tax=Sphingomonas soli TaxID=266127 RepID=UPI00082AC22A|nr:excalibur calcium-binding domain-containing protein [Sphingomonas soli]